MRAVKVGLGPVCGKGKKGSVPATADDDDDDDDGEE